VTDLEEQPSEARPTDGGASVGGSPVPSIVAPVLAWLIPGAGHFYLGKRGRAIAYCAIILAAAFVGCWLQGRLDTVQDNDPLSIVATFASVGSGAIYLALRFLFGYHGNIVAAGFEYGTTFLRTAGILNLLLVLDTFDIARGRKS
jgi:Family of unknown function (DUF6677)